MTDIEDVQKKFGRIWRKELGLEPTEKAVEGANKALPALLDWLKKGEEDVEIVVAAYRCLLVEPEDPEVRPVLEPVFDALNPDWPSIQKNHASLIQAMLIAAWPEEDPGQFDVAPLLDSTWQLIEILPRRKEPIDKWRRRRLENESLNLRGNKDLQESLEGVSGSLAHLDELAESTGYSWDHFGKQLKDVLKEHQECLHNFVSSHDDRMSELLWWGQARYCQETQRPYRKMGDETELLWWCCRGAANIVGVWPRLPTEPSASFLVETLVALGQDVNKSKPLYAWLNEMRSFLSENRIAYNLDDTPLHSLVEETGLGLPLTRLRMKVASNEPFDLPELNLGLNLDSPLERADWTSWVFKEMVLESELEEPPM